MNYGAYPSVTNNLCLTVDNKCQDGNGVAIAASNAALVSEVGKVSTLPSSVPYASGVRYVYSASATVDGAPAPAMMVYYLVGGNQTCSGATVTGTGPAYTSSTTGYSSSNGSVTLCNVPL